MILGHHVIILLRVICKNLKRKSAKKSIKQPILPEEQIPHGAGGLDGTVMQRVRSYTGATFTVGTSTRVGYTDYLVSYDNNLLLSSIKSLYTLYDKLSPLKTAIRITDTTNGEVHV